VGAFGEEVPGQDPEFYVLCYREGPSVHIAFDRRVATSMIEVADLQDWVVFDDKAFRREVARDKRRGRVLIGRRSSDGPADKKVRDFLRRYLGVGSEKLDLDSLIELAAMRNHDEDDASSRRSWRFFAAVLFAVASVLLLRWLLSHLTLANPPLQPDGRVGRRRAPSRARRCTAVSLAGFGPHGHGRSTHAVLDYLSRGDEEGLSTGIRRQEQPSWT
jgi:hypothetical protein